MIRNSKAYACVRLSGAVNFEPWGSFARKLMSNRCHRGAVLHTLRSLPSNSVSRSSSVV